LNCEQKHCILFSCVAKTLEFTNTNNSNWQHFVLQRKQKFGNLSTTLINCMLLCCAAKILEFTNKSNWN
jgi:hypothetical protein